MVGRTGTGELPASTQVTPAIAWPSNPATPRNVGQLDLDFESMELPSEPGLELNVYTAAAGTPTADSLKMLGSWAASQEYLATEAVVTK